MTVKTRNKSPIRYEAIVPSAIVLLLIYGYFYLFFDYHLKRGTEIVATKIHGAEINIHNISTSFWRASFHLNGLQVTDTEHPENNLFEIDNVNMQMLWDALLRAKIVVEDASITGIRAHSKRKRPGYILPPSSPNDSLIGKAQKEILDQAKAKLNENFLGDIVSVLDGADPKEQWKDLKAELKTNVRIKELEKEIEDKRIAWEERIKKLPQPKDLRELETQINALSFSTKNPQELANNIAKAKEIASTAEQKIKTIDQSQKDLAADVNYYKTAIADLKKFTERDIADLQKRLQIPSIDPKEFASQLFLSKLSSNFASIRKYIAVARKYMPPPKKTDSSQPLVPIARGEGKNYTFPVTNGYPAFWLKRSAVSSELNDSDWSGNVSGELKNISTNPTLTKLPIELKLSGEFPKQEIQGLLLHLSLDHTAENAKESLRIKMDSFPILEQSFSDSEKASFGLKSARGAMNLTANISDDSFTFSIESLFSNPNFYFNSSSSQAKGIFLPILNDIKKFTLNAKARGTWDKISMEVDSSLGKELSRGLQKQLQAKLEGAQKQIQQFVQTNISANKNSLESAIQQLSGPEKTLNQNKDSMKAISDIIQKKLKESAGLGGVKGLFKGFGL